MNKGMIAAIAFSFAVWAVAVGMAIYYVAG